MSTHEIPISLETGIKGQILKLIIAAQMNGHEYAGMVAIAEVTPPSLKDSQDSIKEFRDYDGGGYPEMELWNLLIEGGGLDGFVCNALSLPQIKHLTKGKIKKHITSEDPSFLPGYSISLDGAG